jgi:membrane peptidoglycan carboxypeptidase
VSHRHASAPSRRRSRRFLGIELVDDEAESQADHDDPRGPRGPDGPDGPDDGEDEPKPKKSLPRRLLKWTGIALVMFIIAGIGTFVLAYTMIDIPDPNEDFTTETTEVYYSDGKHLLGTFAIQNREEVELSAVPDHVQDAVISAEDRTFWDNAGIDFKGIIRAAWSNARNESTQGASTITQQYVKVLYLTQDRTWSRKLKEAILSLKVQRQLSKQEVLQGYLNTIYFGRGAYGIQAAAEAYFGEDMAVQNLSISQGAVLAAVLNSPSAYDPAAGKEARESLLARYQYVLDGMAEMGSIDPDQAEKLGHKLPKFPQAEERNALGGQRGFLMDLVEQELLDANFTESQIYGGGLQVITTFDWKKQRAAQKVIKAKRKEIKEAGGQKYRQLHIALNSVEPGTGAVRALYAGHNYLSQVKNSQFNWATTRTVQPGSSFKPFALIAALRADYELEDVFNGSSPYYIEATGEDVENQGDSGGSSYGPITLLDATEHSVNTAFVDLTIQLSEEDEISDGANKILRAAEDAGIPSDVVDRIDPVAVTPLGYAPVPAVDMANAYATIAAEGQEADWFTVEKVSDSSGETRYNHRVETEQAFSERIAADVSLALQGVIASPEGTGYAAGIRCPAAGKTGTATAGIGEKVHVSSSWFVGYTPTLATAVNFARGDGDGRLDDWLLPTFYGGDYPAQTWQAYMSKVLEGEECKEFPEPFDELEETEPPEESETTPSETEESETEEPSETPPSETEPSNSHPTHPTHPTETTPSETTPTETTPTETTPTCDEIFCEEDGPGGGGGGPGGGGGGQPAGREPDSAG